MTQEVKKRQKNIVKKNKKYLVRMTCVGISLILFSALLIVSGALYREKHRKITLSDIYALQQEHVNEILAEISKTVELPKDEKPTIATITNVESLSKEMPFFKKAKNGFKVVVYKDKAILFDPVNKKVIDVAPVVQGKNGKVNETTNENNDSE